MKKYALLSIVALLALGGCNKSEPEPSDPGEPVDPSDPVDPVDPVDTGDDIEMTFSYDSKLRKGATYEMPVHYLSSDFSEDNTEYNSNLAINSLALSIASRSVDVATKFFTELKFEDIYTSKDYEESENLEDIAYVFASREIGDKTLIAISVRGFEYSFREVIDNFNIGKDQDHKGFVASSVKVLSALETYLNNYKEKNITYWLTGYSRAGAVASIVSGVIYEDSEKYLTTESDIYAYAFESPNYSFAEKERPFIQTIVNDYDIITHLPPEQIGLHRLGNEINITDDNVADYVNADYEGVDLQPFEMELMNEDGETYTTTTNPLEFYRRVISFLYNEMVSEDGIVAIAKETNLEKLLDFEGEDMSLILSEENIAKAKEFFNSMSDMQKMMFGMTVLAQMSDTENEDALYEYLSTTLDSIGFEYPDSFMKEMCHGLQKVGYHIITAKDEYGTTLLTYILNALNSKEYLIAMHCPEITYSLLVRYEK